MKVKLYSCSGGESPESQWSLGLGYLKSNCSGDITIVADRSELVDCDLIGLSATASGAKEAVDIVSSTDIPVVIGGQITMWEGLSEYPFTHIVIGEGERALQAIIDGETDRRLKHSNISDLDVLNYPDRGECGHVVPILTSRGCPWNCNFCSSQNYWGKVRYHSAEYVMGEVDYIDGAYPNAKFIFIVDDLFIASVKRFNEIYQIWMSKGMDRRFLLHGFVRSNCMTFDIARKMKRMGFGSVRFGAESGSDRVLRLLNKQVTVADHQRCIDICNEVGLPVGCSLMHYVPGETLRDRQLTGDFINRNADRVAIQGDYLFKAFPGTKFYNGENLLNGDWRVRGGKKKLNLIGANKNGEHDRSRANCSSPCEVGSKQ